MPLDRVEYLRRIRNQMLKKLGLPPDTPPEKIQALFEKTDPEDEADLSSDEARVAYLRKIRAGLLKNLGLPQNTPPEK
ncbi:MAG: hypothetical protein AB1896_11960, partial [Thermodesulfobacteriota bacterium]